MTTWHEYYDDFEQKIRLYQQRLPMTEVSFMRLASEALQAAERRTVVVDNTKTISGTDGITFDLTTAGEGYDVLILQKVIDPYGAEIVPQSVSQKQDSMELAYYGLNEPPHRFSRGKVGTTIGTTSGYEHRIYDSNGSQIRVYPALRPSDVLTIQYFVEIHKFSANSPQWAAFFPLNTAFGTAFELAPPLEWQQLDDCMMAYCVMEYLINIGNPNFVVWQQRYEQALQTVKDNQQTFFTEGATPYTTTPHGF